MSQLRVDEIRNSAGSETTAPAIPALEPRLAQAWVNFNGTGVVAIRDSFNVDSVTDSGTGDYLVNFSQPFDNLNYCVVVSSTSEITQTIFNGYSVGSIRVISAARSGALQDTTVVNVQVFSN